MHKVFTTPELSDEILSYLPRHTHTVTARVCKLWFTHSIQLIWDTVGLNDILRVLSPFDENGFRQPLLSGSWHRFFLYSKNIREIRCDRIQPAALRQAVLWRPNVDLFSSKLDVVQWNGPLDYIEFLPSLITSTSQTLKVRLNTINCPDMLDILHQTIPLRSPSLRAFELIFPPKNNHTTEVVSKALRKLFSLLPEIVLVSLPSHCMTEELFLALSQLPQLQDLLLIHWSSQLNEFPSTDKGLRNSLKRKMGDNEQASGDIPFRSLGKMDIFNSEFIMAETLRRGFQLPRLIELTYRGSSFDHTITFMGLLHKICPNLENIRVYTYNGLPFQAIRSLLKCRALVGIFSKGTVDMELGDIATIATDRSSWKLIAIPSVKAFGYQALIPFAQNCPHLVKLSLTLDSKLGIPDSNTFATDVKFASLNLLSSGVSEATPDFELVFFLSKVCSKPIRIIAYASEETRRLWGTVEKLVNSIITTQLEIRTLKNENMLLRTQNCNNI